jgi:hypothetical protein
MPIHGFDVQKKRATWNVGVRKYNVVGLTQLSHHVSMRCVCDRNCSLVQRQNIFPVGNMFGF